MEILAPDFEVVVRVNASDVVVAACFIDTDGNVDMLVGVASTDAVAKYQHLLELVTAGLNNASWKPLDELGIDDGSDEDADGAIPF